MQVVESHARKQKRSECDISYLTHVRARTRTVVLVVSPCNRRREDVRVGGQRVGVGMEMWSNQPCKCWRWRVCSKIRWRQSPLRPASPLTGVSVWMCVYSDVQLQEISVNGLESCVSIASNRLVFMDCPLATVEGLCMDTRVFNFATMCSGTENPLIWLSAVFRVGRSLVPKILQQIKISHSFSFTQLQLLGSTVRLRPFVAGAARRHVGPRARAFSKPFERVCRPPAARDEVLEGCRPPRAATSAEGADDTTENFPPEDVPPKSTGAAAPPSAAASAGQEQPASCLELSTTVGHSTCTSTSAGHHHHQCVHQCRPQCRCQCGHQCRPAVCPPVPPRMGLRIEWWVGGFHASGYRQAATTSASTSAGHSAAASAAISSQGGATASASTSAGHSAAASASTSAGHSAAASAGQGGTTTTRAGHSTTACWRP